MSDGKCIASAHWLNDVLTEQKLFPPSNPLHFPTAFKWLMPGAERYVSSSTWCLAKVKVQNSCCGRGREEKGSVYLGVRGWG